MCLSVPAKVIMVSQREGEVSVYGERRRVYLAAEQVKVGDWVLVYGGVALAVLDPQEAEETLALIHRMKD